LIVWLTLSVRLRVGVLAVGVVVAFDLGLEGVRARCPEPVEPGADLAKAPGVDLVECAAPTG